jgi:hypothetical protein
MNYTGLREMCLLLLISDKVKSNLSFNFPARRVSAVSLSEQLIKYKLEASVLETVCLVTGLL